MVVVEIIAVRLQNAKGILGRLFNTLIRRRKNGTHSSLQASMLFPVPEHDFNLGYHSADEVANELEPTGNLLLVEVVETEESLPPR